SRRRHTRFSRDWSSDVCSSDLNSLVSEKCPPAQVICCISSKYCQCTLPHDGEAPEVLTVKEISLISGFTSSRGITTLKKPVPLVVSDNSLDTSLSPIRICTEVVCSNQWVPVYNNA